mmetsp:Transcript_18943/g.37293  ORF Transcript_18943/g.37293 Transcript_18943/m.37293 type:complete len:275 (+) Transcript_18943:2613-3437(+)
MSTLGRIHLEETFVLAERVCVAAYGPSSVSGHHVSAGFAAFFGRSPNVMVTATSNIVGDTTPDFIGGTETSSELLTHFLSSVVGVLPTLASDRSPAFPCSSSDAPAQILTRLGAEGVVKVHELLFGDVTILVRIKLLESLVEAFNAINKTELFSWLHFKPWVRARTTAVAAVDTTAEDAADVSAYAAEVSPYAASAAAPIGIGLGLVGRHVLYRVAILRKQPSAPAKSSDSPPNPSCRPSGPPPNPSYRPSGPPPNLSCHPPDTPPNFPANAGN